MAYLTLKSNVVLAGLLACALTPRAFAAGFAKPNPKDVEFVSEITQKAEQDPKVGTQIKAYLNNNTLNPQKIVSYKMMTPANVQQYASAVDHAAPTKTLYSSYVQTRALLEEAGAMVAQAKQAARNDPPKEYVAETGAKVMDILDKTFNETNTQVQERVNKIRANLQEMVAIALIVNSGGTAAAKGPGKPLQQGIEARQGKTSLVDAAFGEKVKQTVEPELSLGIEGTEKYKQSDAIAEEIDQRIMAEAGESLDKARGLAKEVIDHQAKYSKAMKGQEEATGTGEVLLSAIDSLGNHLMMLNDSANRLKAFIKGPGRVIYDVLDCSRKTYAAAVALTQDLPDATQIALGQIALDSNLKAARGVGPMASQFQGLLAWLGNEAAPSSISGPGHSDRYAPPAGHSQSGDAEKTKRAIRRGVDTVTQ